MDASNRHKLKKFEVLTPEKERKTILNEKVAFFSRPYVFKSEGRAYLNNIYGVEIEYPHKKLEFDMLTSMEPDYPRSLMFKALKKDVPAIAGINTNFFYLVDDTKSLPKDYSYNLNISNGILYQLPNAGKTALLVAKNGDLKTSFIKAKGDLIIGDTKINWVGSRSKYLAVAKKTFGIIYNTANMGVIRKPNPLTGSKRIPDSSRSHTPFAEGRMDLVMNIVSGHLLVTSITNGGTHFFQGNFIISVPKTIGRKIKVGSKLSYCQIDNFSLDELRAAVTVGVSIPKTKILLGSQLKKEVSIIAYNQEGNPLFEESARFSRSVVFGTKNKIVFMIADSRPKVDAQLGMTLFDLQKCIYSLYPDIIWAVNCDGGHTSKLAVVMNKEIKVFGNLHYKIWPKRSNNNFIWDGENGRKIPSLLIIKRKH